MEIKLNGITGNSENPMVKEIFKKSGDFYLSKPAKASGDAKYVWRMVAFYAGIRPEMPVTAEFDLEDHYWPKRNDPLYEGSWEHRRAHIKELDEIVNEILSCFPRRAERGTIRWGKALGVL